MKPKLLLLLVLFTAPFLTACNDSQQKKIDQEEAKATSETNRAFGEITFLQADSIVRNYQDNFKPVLEQSSRAQINSSQTKHVWIDINELKSFIDIVEDEAKSEKFNNTKLSGIRFYFAAYLQDGYIHEKPEYARRTTLVGCGTYKDEGTGLHRDLIKKSAEDTVIKALVLGYQNHGHLCPPEADEFCKGAGLGHYP